MPNLRFLIILFLFNRLLFAADYYVDTDGIGGFASDNNSGTIEKPWKTLQKAFVAVKPGDTVYIRKGYYYQNRPLLGRKIKNDKKLDIAFKAFKNEKVTITSMKSLDSLDLWEHEYGQIYSTKLTPQPNPQNILVGRIPNCSQNGIPLKLMSKFDENAGPVHLKGPGQWVRDTNTWKVYVWAIGSGNPGNKDVQICEFPYGGINTIDLQRNPNSVGGQADKITFEGLIIEGGYYTIRIETDYIYLKNCVFRNCYADAIKIAGAKPKDFNHPNDLSDKDYWNSENGLIQNCDIYHFGEAGIDLTGGDNWLIQGNRIHDDVSNRGNFKNSTLSHGIMLKNNCKDIIVHGNFIYNLNNTAFGGITIGGQSFGGIAKEAERVEVQNNIFLKIKGPYIVLFDGAVDCSFFNNLIYDCHLTQAIIRFSRSNYNNYLTKNYNCSIFNNIFYKNEVAYGSKKLLSLAYLEHPNDAIQGLYTDYNMIDKNMKYKIMDGVFSLDEFRMMGYEKKSILENPVFQGEHIYNFRPLKNSPQTNSGTPLSTKNLSGLLYNDFMVDMDNKPVPDKHNKIVDIGPYEYYLPDNSVSEIK